MIKAIGINRSGSVVSIQTVEGSRQFAFCETSHETDPSPRSTTRFKGRYETLNKARAAIFGKYPGIRLFNPRR
jgi:hypothetical protein